MPGKPPRQFVSFDWAMKTLLRSKANFDILEGFLSELLKEDVTIVEILESEGNQESDEDKFNRVDLLVKDANDQRIVIEIQYKREADYFQRMLYGAAKVVTENLDEGEPYASVKRVISVNLVYFDLGHGDDYVYYGETNFSGIHKHGQLELNAFQQELFGCSKISRLFPTYYIIKINSFENVAKDGLDQWIYFLKNEQLPEPCSAKGLGAAKEKLAIMRLSATERQAYERYQKHLHIQASEMEFSIKRAEKAESELARTQTMLLGEKERVELALRQKEEERRQKEEERQQKEEERRQKEAALEKLEAAVTALVAAGHTREDARKIVGLG